MYVHFSLCKTCLLHVLVPSASPNTFALQLAGSEVSNCGYAYACAFYMSWPDNCLEERNNMTSWNLKK
jgi:hypothetical protein